MNAYYRHKNIFHCFSARTSVLRQMISNSHFDDGRYFIFCLQGIYNFSPVRPFGRSLGRRLEWASYKPPTVGNESFDLLDSKAFTGEESMMTREYGWIAVSLCS